MTGRAPPPDPDERVARLAHDLRSPLTVVAGFAELLRARGEGLSAAERAEFVERIAAGTREMRDLLDAERVARHERQAAADSATGSGAATGRQAAADSSTGSGAAAPNQAPPPSARS